MGYRSTRLPPRRPPPPAVSPASPASGAVRKRPFARLRVPRHDLVLVTVTFALAVLLLLVYSALESRQPRMTEGDVKALAAQVMASATPPPSTAARVYGAVQPSVVLIKVEDTHDGKTDEGAGTGVVLDQMGNILTSLHVVDGASKIEVMFVDGTVAPATVAVREPKTDIAVLNVRVAPQLLVPATLGNPGELQVGDEVVAVGNPFGLVHSVSAGVVSGLNRSFQGPHAETPIEGLIQFDAAVNPGNSGGPLLNRNGEVVGIVTALLNPSDQRVFIGIGFAVPIEVAASAAGSPPF